ncbi:hypothetical protein EYF80_061859 [Liparis tanakae]|uniref:Uncharacterized protein n=1 Tax=Liparis tanakae TaxID=230148 RepID=A0A4Z2EGT9_9TELE|nr:hypothetical protein EYF80_061859 [Liparis tanakae]
MCQRAHTAAQGRCRVHPQE